MKRPEVRFGEAYVCLFGREDVNYHMDVNCCRYPCASQSTHTISSTLFNNQYHILQTSVLQVHTAYTKEWNNPYIEL